MPITGRWRFCAPCRRQLENRPRTVIPAVKPFAARRAIDRPQSGPMAQADPWRTLDRVYGIGAVAAPDLLSKNACTHPNFDREIVSYGLRYLGSIEFCVG